MGTIEHKYEIYEAKSKIIGGTHRIRISWRFDSAPPPILPVNTGLDLTAFEAYGALRGVWLVLVVRHAPALRGGTSSVVYTVKKIK